VVAATDAGRAINPLAVEGQAEGAILMGMGYALTEEMVIQDGHVLSDSLARYRLPTARQMPEITPILVEHPVSTGAVWRQRGWRDHLHSHCAGDHQCDLSSNWQPF
jgi:xanthine dehydrogenase molybdenum-binding subunit